MNSTLKTPKPRLGKGNYIFAGSSDPIVNRTAELKYFAKRDAAIGFKDAESTILLSRKSKATDHTTKWLEIIKAWEK
jgi:hypothetical protein